MYLAMAMTMALALGMAAPVSADVWDIQSDNDDGSGTDNELIHGSDQLHDLGVRPGPVADEDWYVIGQKPRSSYEVVVDATSGDIGFNTNLLQLVDAAGALVLNGASVTPGRDYSRSLRFQNLTASPIVNQFVRVGPGNCGTGCGSDDVYHIRAMETTVNVARFNQAGGQVTVVLVQNASDVTVSGTIFFWSPTGVLLASSGFSLAPKSSASVNTATIAALAGQAGSITIPNSAPYGTLNVKAVALEPATGFSFDTPGTYRGF